MIPIFIYVREKSDRELREEMKRDAAWEENERRRKERERQEKIRKENEKKKREKELNDEYDRMKKENPWDFAFMPGGWSIFGQINFSPISDIEIFSY